MKVVNIDEAKKHFSKLINSALSGEEIVIAKGGTLLVKLTPYSEAVAPRRGGQLQGVLKMSDDFDAPLSGDVLEQFYQDDGSRNIC